MRKKKISIDRGIAELQLLVVKMQERSVKDVHSGLRRFGEITRSIDLNGVDEAYRRELYGRLAVLTDKACEAAGDRKPKKRKGGRK
jgi:hypothetical protein